MTAQGKGTHPELLEALVAIANELASLNENLARLADEQAHTALAVANNIGR